MYDDRILSKCTHADSPSSVILKLKAMFGECSSEIRTWGQPEEGVSNVLGNTVLLTFFHSEVRACSGALIAYIKTC